MASPAPTSAPTSAPTEPPVLQRTPTAGTHSCFICFQTDAEAPGLPFVNFCPCTLEAHEACLLAWISEREKTTSAKPVCPVCQHRINVEEQYDAVVALKESLHRGFARVSPYVLLALVMSGGAVGSGWYGLMSSHIFAGPEATARWLGLQSLIGRTGRAGPLYRWMPFWRFTVKTWMLSCVGPGLVVWRAIPGVGNLLLMPISLMSAAVLVAHDDMPHWPPSPAWAATMFPFVTLTYNNIYYEFFGALEKRLNRALRARPVVDEPQPIQEEGAPPAGQLQVQVEGQAQIEGQEHGDDHNEVGVWTSLWNLGQAVVGIFRDREMVWHFHAGMRDGAELNGNDFELNGNDFELNDNDVELNDNDVELNDNDVELNDNDVELNGNGDELEIGVQADEVEDLLNLRGGAPEDIEEWEQEHEEQDSEDDEEDILQLEDNPAHHQPLFQEVNAVQPQEAPAPEPAPAPVQDNDPAPDAALENRPVGTLNDIVSGIVLSLLQPTICFGMGEILRLALPRSWVAPRSRWGRDSPGLLQHQWGRSLVGGCAYVVIRDVFKLYAKYRQVQVKGKRKVKNVERRPGTS